jgi:hypothetical protein
MKNFVGRASYNTLQYFFEDTLVKNQKKWTHLGWSSGIGLGLGSVLLLKVSSSILSVSGANLSGLM